ncbi:MAG: glycine/betaine ABC transporter substrate-binding protein [Acidimicrobiales bacterium]|nr:glycine/betaine ABC transporter substrate-binding protein [Acidimicrobiales bacterium]
MRRSRLHLFAGVVLAFTLLVAACGDDDDTTATTSESSDTTAAAGGEGAVIEFKPLDAGGPLTTAALESGDIDVALMFSSQGIIAQNGWVVLEDDQGLQPVENLVPVGRADALTPDVAAALDEVSAALTTEELAELNRRVDADKEDPAVVAEDWLTQEGLLDAEATLEGTSITVGSADFSEQEIVANMYADVLGARGADVTRQFRLGSREVVNPALESGEVDVVPEYVGSLLTFLEGSPTSDLDQSLADLQAALESVGLVALTPSPAEDKNALVVTQETADEYGLTTISDLASVTDTLVLGGPPECPERPLCILGFEEVYGLQFDV